MEMAAHLYWPVAGVPDYRTGSLAPCVGFNFAGSYIQ
jgi:hypothetical protein